MKQLIQCPGTTSAINLEAALLVPIAPAPPSPAAKTWPPTLLVRPAPHRAVNWRGPALAGAALFVALAVQSDRGVDSPAPKVPAHAQPNAWVSCAFAVNLRQQPGTRDLNGRPTRVIAELPVGLQVRRAQTVVVVEPGTKTSGRWAYVQAGELRGWVNQRLLRDTPCSESNSQR